MTTDEIIERIRERAGQGWSDRRIARELELQKDRVIRLRKRAGIPSAWGRSDVREFSAENDTLLRQFVAAGVGDTEIGRRFGRSQNWVRGYRRKFAIQRPEVVRAVSPITREFIAAGIAAGKTNDQMARELGVARCRVRDRRREFGFVQERGRNGYRTTERSLVKPDEQRIYIRPEQEIVWPEGARFEDNERAAAFKPSRTIYASLVQPWRRRGEAQT